MKRSFENIKHLTAIEVIERLEYLGCTWLVRTLDEDEGGPGYYVSSSTSDHEQESYWKTILEEGEERPYMDWRTTKGLTSIHRCKSYEVGLRRCLYDIEVHLGLIVPED